MRQRLRSGFRTMLIAGFAATAICVAQAQTKVPSPEDVLGYLVGTDYKLARWEQIVDYFGQVGKASPRVNVREIGKTTEGRPMILAEISSEDTIRDLATHRENQRKIADPRLIADADEKRRLIEDSKVVLLINCNLHSTEIASSQMAMELLYDLATGDSDRVREILDRTIIILVPSANPDGEEKVVDWYERSREKPWEGTGMPWLYHKYAGHDNNRDWFMLALQETRLLTRVLYQEWRPTIVYDIHQMGNRSIRFFVPPFHDPKNANVHPLIDQSILLIGGHMATELAQNDKKGVMHGAIYDNWWSGGFRTTPYRHNMVGLLTEAASPLIATPIFQRKSELRGGGRGMASYDMTSRFPDPWPGGWWRLRDVVDYEKIACMSLFTLAARYREMFQGNYIRFGKEAVERGATEPPFAWLVPPDQLDPGTADKMIGILMATGIEVHRATDAFEADGATYPAGTYVLYCAQPYRAHLNDMMERQVYPEQKTSDDGAVEPPYDIAGWTLPLQMGVRHVGVRQRFDCDADKLTDVPAATGRIEGPSNAEAYVIEARRNDNFTLLNRLHKAGLSVSVYTGDEGKKIGQDVEVGPGSIVVRDARGFRDQSASLVDGLAVDVAGVSDLPAAIKTDLTPLPAPRLGLYQPWTASTDEGWTRLVLENFEFPLISIHDAEVCAGRLAQRYDCIVLPSVSGSSIREGREPDTTAPEYVGGIGDEGIVALQEFVTDGGTLVCIDQSCNLPIDYFNIPVKNIVRGKKSSEFYCPGSVLRVAVDTNHPIGYGMPEWVSAYFTRSQAFAVDTGAGTKRNPRDPAVRFPVTVVARYADTVLLESGWIKGANLIEDMPAIVEVAYGQGRIILFGFRVQHRAQPHGTFPLLFNAIAQSTWR